MQFYIIVLLKSETMPRKGSLDMDQARIKAAAKYEKTQRELERWVKLYKDKTFIRIEEDYMFCNEAQKWLRKSD